MKLKEIKHLVEFAKKVEIVKDNKVVYFGIAHNIPNELWNSKIDTINGKDDRKETEILKVIVK